MLNGPCKYLQVNVYTTSSSQFMALSLYNIMEYAVRIQKKHIYYLLFRDERNNRTNELESCKWFLFYRQFVYVIDLTTYYSSLVSKFIEQISVWFYLYEWSSRADAFKSFSILNNLVSRIIKIAFGRTELENTWNLLILHFLCVCVCGKLNMHTENWTSLIG